MANLIPQEQLKTQSRAMVGRAVLTGALLCFFASIAVIFGLVPAYMRAHTERIAKAEALAALQSAKDNDRSDREILLAMRKRTAALGTIGKKAELSVAFSMLLSNRPKGVALRTFVYGRKDGASTLSVSGAASDPSAFRAYSEALKGKAPIDKVTVPLTSLANIEGGAFTITASGSF
ncbi:hypothetical protein HY413_00210 [Candidatus Kaiserbacteria bacterium]|nr:hypothetical protein [Candidatus Kaiserbacteria bacterium]